LGQWRRLARGEHTLTTAATATQSFDESGSSSTCSALQFSASAIVCFAIYLLNEARLKAHPEPAKAQ
jgi:hypothetical protein